MKQFTVTAAVGIKAPITFPVMARSRDEALQLAEWPNGELRTAVEDAMTEQGVDPGLRGWHNYEVLSAEETQDG